MAGPCFANFSTRGFELRADRELAPEAKASVSPVFTLTRARNAESFLPTMLAVMDASEGREVVVDFDPVPKRAWSAEASRRTKSFNREVAGFVAPRAGRPNGMDRPRREPFRRRAHRAVEGLGTPGSSRSGWPTSSGVRVAFRPGAEDSRSSPMSPPPFASLRIPQARPEAARVRGFAEPTVRRLDAALKGLKDSDGAAFDAARKAVVVVSVPGGSLGDRPGTLRIEETRIHASVAERWGG